MAYICKQVESFWSNSFPCIRVNVGKLKWPHLNVRNHTEKTKIAKTGERHAHQTLLQFKYIIIGILNNIMLMDVCFSLNFFGNRAKNFVQVEST